jgi:Tol biopolymer transport system component
MNYTEADSMNYKNLLFIIIIMSLLFPNCKHTAKTITTNIEQFKNLTQITFHKTNDFEPNISPDGKKMLFVSNRDGDYNIYLKKNIYSKSIIKKTSHSANDINPCFSPEGSKFAFSSNRNGNYDIFVMNVEKGSAKTQITLSDNDDCFPNWSPEGNKIAFSQYSSLDKQWYIWIKNLKSGELTQVSRGLMPKFLPDGNRILYKKSNNNYFGLWIMDPDGENDTQILQGEKWGVGSFCINRTGGKILFSIIAGTYGKRFKYGYSDNYTDLWIVNIDGTKFTQITKQKGNDLHPFWASTDEIYFASKRDGYINIWKFTPALEKKPWL